MLKVKQKFKRQFLRSTFTRFHMSLILMGTILAGVVFSKLLLLAGLQNMLVRFIIVLILAYLSFFLFMRLWLNYLTKPFRNKKHKGSLLDAADVVSNIPDFSSSSGSQYVQGHGGEFGGAGASDIWEGVSENANIPVSGGSIETSESIGGLAGEAAGDTISGIADEGGIFLIPLLLLLAAIFGGGIYLIYEAPAIISEAAFELILATTVIKKARKIDNPDWIGSVFRTTWPALSLTLIITIITGWGLMAYYPQATKIKEVIQYCL